MEALDLLEKRIDALTVILGPVETREPSQPLTASGKAENIIDSLISVNSLLTSATSGREQINKTLERSAELEKYMDPDYLEQSQQVRSKEVYINAVSHDLRNEFQQLEQIKQLEPTLGAEYFRNIPEECTTKLKQCSADNGEFAQQVELIEESLILAMKRYGELQSGLLGSLDGMNKRLEAIENKLETKKQQKRAENVD